MKIGAHVSSSGGIDKCIERAKNIGANCCQFFISPPQQWAQIIHSQIEIDEFRKQSEISQVHPNFIHGTYLINLASQNPANLEKGINWLIYALDLADDLGVEGIIFHTGSHGGKGFGAVKDQITNALQAVLKKSKARNAFLILENSSGGGGSVGSNFAELGQLIKCIDSDRIKVCIDTCHAYTSGYDIKHNLDDVLKEFDEKIGLKELVALHANDCKFDLGSKRDRHENIGEGFLGKAGFAGLLTNPKLQDLPFILEVPGFDNSGPDQHNVEILQKLAEN